MKESTIKREVRNLDDVTTEIVTLDKGWLYTAVHRSPESDTIETQYIEEKEEIIKLRRKEIWEKAEILEKEEIEVSYDNEEEEVEKKNYKNKVDKKGNQIDLMTTVSKAKGDIPYIDCRSMVKFDEKDGLIFKTANLVSSKTLNIPRGIFPLKNLVIEKGKMTYWFYNPFDNINELKDVDKSIFLYNVYSSQLLQSFSKAHREPPISVSTLVKIIKEDIDKVVISSENEKGVKVFISKKEDLSFKVSVERFGERLDVSFDTKNEDILFRVIRSFLAYIGLGLDDIDLLTLKTLGIRINSNDSKDNIIYIKKYTKFIVKENRMEETILLENIKTKF